MIYGKNDNIFQLTQKAMSTIYYDQNNVKVTDAVFVTPIGDQYPIRNITSVSVRAIDNKLYLYLGLFFTALGFYLIFTSSVYAQTPPAGIGNSSSSFSIIGLIFFSLGMILLYLWKKSKEFALKIGTGGMIQNAITFPRKNQTI